MGRKSRKKRERRGKEERQAVVADHKQKAEVLEEDALLTAGSTVEKICLAVIRWGTYLALLTPLIIDSSFFFPFVSPKSLYFRAFVEIIVAAYLILILVAPRFRPRLHSLTIALLILLGSLTISCIIGANFSKSFWSNFERMEGLLSWLHYFAFFIVLSSVFRRKKDWLHIFTVTVGIAAAVSVASFIYKGETFKLAELAKKGATLGNSSFLGTYLLFNAFINIWLLAELKGRKIWRSILAGCFVLIVIALMISTARAAMVCFIGGVILIGLLYLIFKARKKVWKIVGISVILLGILSFFFVAYFAFQYDSGVHTFLVEHKLFKQPRVVVWTMAWEGFKERPLFGWGLENFDVPFTKYFNPCLGTDACGTATWFDRAHNFIFDTLITAGVVGFILYVIGVFCLSIYLLAKRFFRTKQFWLSAVFITVLIAYFFENLTVFDMVASYMMFFLVLAFIASSTNRKSLPPAKKLFFSGKKQFLSVLMMLLMLIFFVSFVIQPLRASKLSVKCLTGADAKDFNERMENCRQGCNISSLGKYQSRGYFGEIMTNISKNPQVKNLLPEDFQAGFELAVEELEKSFREHPLDYRSHLRLGELYNAYPLADRSKYFARAEEVLEAAIALSPTDQKGYQALIQNKLWQNANGEALELAKKTVELEPGLAQSQWILAEVANLNEDYELARQAAQEAGELGYPYWRSTGALNRYIQIFNHFQDYDEIIQAYKKALSSLSNDQLTQKAQLYFDFGSFYKGIGRNEEALVQFEEARKSDPSLNSEIDKILGK